MTPLDQLVGLARSQDMGWHADQQWLTDTLLRPAMPEIIATLTRLRGETDAWAAGAATPRAGYPVGFCAVIRDRVFEGLVRDPGIRRLTDAGLGLRKVFVILKGQFFQNAIQFGNLYIDVANDTVDPDKPWLEWSEVTSVPFENIGNLSSLARVASSYHRCRVFPNLLFPLVSPVAPLLAVGEGGWCSLLHFQDGGFLKDLADGFPQLRAWLTGPARDLPPLPASHAARLREICGANAFTAFPFEYRPCSFEDVAAQAGDYTSAYADPARHDSICGVLRLIPEAVRTMRGMSFPSEGISA